MQKTKMELLNMLTGFLLIIVGSVDLLDSQYLRAASWIIFGSMYLVMDSYKDISDSASLFERFAARTRHTFAWVGFVGSVILLTYRLWIFMY